MNIQSTISADTGAEPGGWAPESVFADPVGYLADLGLVAELVGESHLPAAA